ncbi:hypothetical protein [Microvirga pudoricolor]|uniref:hypothetical protein n=1 Tax=Microvirga pudoricolor TaxID=2778729 RepID=UPI0019514CD9|nr:hypothetical protein [Microvirga pudoricolor]MBM6592491.1 hypothetical protein [Microvirga pudoricolor]
MTVTRKLPSVDAGPDFTHGPTLSSKPPSIPNEVDRMFDTVDEERDEPLRPFDFRTGAATRASAVAGHAKLEIPDDLDRAFQEFPDDREDAAHPGSGSTASGLEPHLATVRRPLVRWIIAVGVLVSLGALAPLATKDPSRAWASALPPFSLDQATGAAVRLRDMLASAGNAALAGVPSLKQVTAWFIPEPEPDTIAAEMDVPSPPDEASGLPTSQDSSLETPGLPTLEPEQTAQAEPAPNAIQQHEPAPAPPILEPAAPVSEPAQRAESIRTQAPVQDLPADTASIPVIPPADVTVTLGKTDVPELQGASDNSLPDLRDLALNLERERAEKLTEELTELRGELGAMKAKTLQSWLTAPSLPPTLLQPQPETVPEPQAVRDDAVGTDVSSAQAHVDLALPDPEPSAPVTLPPPATSNPAPARTLAQAPVQSTAGPSEDKLIQRAEALLKNADISGARLILEHAMSAGSARATYLLAQTYDPKVLASWRVVGIKGDSAKAQELYARALAGGVREAGQR